MSFLHNPRQVPLRRWLFQIHLWAGLVLGLYFVLIGLTGSLIVYKKELERWAIPRLIQVPASPSPGPGFQALYDAVQAAYPRATISNVFLYPAGTSWSFRLSQAGERVQVYVDPGTGRILGEDRYGGKFLQWVYDFHVDLLAGRVGEILNGVGGWMLALMSLSGIVIWWPGVRHWRGALRYARKAGWKRQNYDWHRFSGLITASFLLLLGVTGAYWTWPREYESALAWMTRGPARTAAPLVPKTERSQWQSLDVILAEARRALPEGEPSLFRFASRPGDTHSLKRILPTDWRTQGDDTVYLDPAAARVVRVDYHDAQPLGVRLQRDIYGLHFGTFGGHATRLAWIGIGLAPLVLAVTGLLMYRNRVWVKRSASWNRPVAHEREAALEER